MDPQLPTFEPPWFAVKEINEREISRRHRLAAVVTMKVEEIPFITGGNLRFYACDGELFHLELPQYLWQDRLDPIQHKFLVLAYVHQDARAAVFVINNPAFGMRRDDFAGLEVGLVFEDETCEFGQFLRGEELVQHHASRRQLLRPLCCRDAALRDHLCTYAVRRLRSFRSTHRISWSQRLGRRTWLHWRRLGASRRLRIFGPEILCHPARALDHSRSRALLQNALH